MTVPPVAPVAPKTLLQSVGTVVSSQAPAFIAGAIAICLIAAITVMACLNKTVPSELPNALYVTLGGGAVALKTGT